MRCRSRICYAKKFKPWSVGPTRVPGGVVSAGDGQVKKGWKKAKDRFTILFSDQAEERVRK